tara:strand:- start:825 stop:4211 length:3387 start_codon:yes stop_codon:yes gene_type:complete
METKIKKSLIDFSKYNDDENYNKLEKKINKLLELLDLTNNKNDKQIILDNIEEIKLKMNINSINSSISYPDYIDNNFIKKIITKKEFAINKIDKNDRDYIVKDFFELTNNQKFLKKLISPETPYRSIYMFHSVGVGKTCASIQITDNFKKYYKKKTLILLPLKLKDNFIKGLFDISKLSDDNMEQCLGNYYLHNIVGRNRMDVSDIKSKVKKMINSEYEILSFGEFGNLFKRIKNNSKNNVDFINKIRKYFDERVIIVDEVHNMRLTNDDVKGKEVSKNFHEMLELLKKNVLVLLSATPMFDNYLELKFILNTLLIQNGLPKIQKKDIIFKNDKDDKLNPEFEKRLKKISNNFISYMRGENPFTFPIRMFPSVNGDSHILKINKYPKLDIYGNKIPKNEQIKNLELIFTTMSGNQESMYNLIKTPTQESTNNLSDNNDNNDDDDDEQIVDIQQRVQVSNIVYDTDDDIKSIYGNNGLKRVFKIENNKKGNYKVEYKDKKKEILDYSNIGNYSPKIKLLLKNIKKSDGIVLVYSRYLASGIIPIAIALEHLGFHKFGGKNILNGGTRESKKGNYIVISGNTYLSPNNTDEITECTNKNNKDGDKIKVILITESGTEGLDLKNVREIHIFDPWYNLNRLEQVIGRGVRNFSHINLPSIKRNTTIFQYVNLTGNNKRESIDFRTYRIAENKQKQISILERVIKRNAIDCNLNINSNKFDDLKPIKLLTSHGKLIENFNINDKTNSRICDYGKCDLECDTKIDIDKLDDATYKEEIIKYDINLVKRHIIKYFKENINYSATLEDLLKIPNLKLTNNEMLYFALNNLIKNKVIFKKNNNRSGYLIYKSNNYIFQPEDIKDNKILLHERAQPKLNKVKKLDISEIDIVEVDNNVNNKIKYNNYDDFLKKQISDITTKLLFDDDDIQKYEQYIYDILIDNFNQTELKIMFKNLLQNTINNGYTNKIRSSLKKGLYIQNDQNILYNHFDDHFVCLNEGKIEKCSPIQDKTNRQLLNKSLKNITNKMEINKLGYFENIKDEPVFKMIDLDKMKDNKSVSGTRCIITSTITTKKLTNFIILNDKNILKSNDELIKKFKKKKYTKPNLCLLYELVLRKITNDKKLNFIRPILNNYLKKI